MSNPLPASQPLASVSVIDPWRLSALKTYERGQALEYASSVLDVANTGCTPVKMTATDGHVYWVKPQHNDHGQLSIVAERIVAAAAEFLGAPIAESTLLTIPEGWHDARYKSPNHAIHSGTAHASRIISGTLVEDTELKFIRNDGNSLRAPPTSHSGNGALAMTSSGHTTKQPITRCGLLTTASGLAVVLSGK